MDINKVLNKEKLFSIIDKFSTIKPILVLGDVCIDVYAEGIVTRISPEAPVPIVNVKKQRYKLGMSANVANNLKALDVKNTLISVEGTDQDNHILRNLLDEFDYYLLSDAGRRTIKKKRVIASNQQICRIDYEDIYPINETLETKFIDIIKSNIDNFSAIIIEDYGKGFLTKNLVQATIDIFKQNNKLVLVDPSNNADPMIYKNADYITPNFSEGIALIRKLERKEDDLGTIASTLKIKLNLQGVIITRSEKGMTFCTNHKMKNVPSFAKYVVDVSGAGDTAIAVLTTALVCGATLEEAVLLSSFASAIVVEKQGTASLFQEELKNRILTH